MASSEKWSNIGEVGFVWGMRFLFFLYRYIGTWALTAVLQPVVFYYFITHKIARQSSKEFLQRVHSATGLEEPSWLDVYRHLLTFAQSTIDKLGVWADSSIFEPVDFPNREILLEQLATGKGAVLLGAHLGNMEICRSLFSAKYKHKLNVLVYTRHANMFNKLLKELDLQADVELIDVSQVSPATAIRLANCVERGELIAILADRVPVASRGRSREVQFLGDKALFPDGPFILASLLKCPVYTIFCTRSEKGYGIRCEKFSDMIRLPRLTRDDALKKYVMRFAEILEENALKTPLQWFNFYPFWVQKK